MARQKVCKQGRDDVIVKADIPSLIPCVNFTLVFNCNVIRCRGRTIKFCLFSGAIALTLATFGQGIQPIFLDEVACMGIESKLTDCQHQGILFHHCSHDENAGVVCPGKCNALECLSYCC